MNLISRPSLGFPMTILWVKNQISKGQLLCQRLHWCLLQGQCKLLLRVSLLQLPYDEVPADFCSAKLLPASRENDLTTPNVVHPCVPFPFRRATLNLRPDFMSLLARPSLSALLLLARLEAGLRLRLYWLRCEIRALSLCRRRAPKTAVVRSGTGLFRAYHWGNDECVSLLATFMHNK